MKALLIASVLLASMTIASPAEAQPLTLDPAYMRADGSIISLESSHVIDPYFPTKALLVAEDNGLSIRQIGEPWIKWMLSKQDDNGLFSRFCFKDGEPGYQACAVADADDSMMALWIELLYRLSPKAGLPEKWRLSAQKALYQLDSIYDAPSGVFFVSRNVPAGLLMDNIEIYASFKNIAQSARRIGDEKQAKDFDYRAAQLKAGIIRTFWDEKTGSFKASTQPRKEAAFYPDTVVQLVPMMYGFKSPELLPQEQTYTHWMNDHRAEWFKLIGQDYPWGLLAVLAVDRGDSATANCWLQEARPYRDSRNWDVLDEAAFQSVAWRLQKKWPEGNPLCEEEGTYDRRS